MRTRLVVLPLLLTAALGLAGCSDDSPDTSVTDEGVVETPSGERGGAGLDAPSGEPLVPDSSAEPGAGVTATPSS